MCFRKKKEQVQNSLKNRRFSPPRRRQLNANKAESDTSRETSAEASEAKKRATSCAFCRARKKLEAWAEGQRKGQSEGRPAAG